MGRWPSATYEALPEDEKTRFTQDLHGRSQQEVEAYCAEKLKGYERHEEYYEEGGAFLPLAAWATKGYDVDSILDVTFFRDLRGGLLTSRCISKAQNE